GQRGDDLRARLQALATARTELAVQPDEQLQRGRRQHLLGTLGQRCGDVESGRQVHQGSSGATTASAARSRDFRDAVSTFRILSPASALRTTWRRPRADMVDHGDMDTSGSGTEHTRSPTVTYVHPAATP